ncbi:hypothetical protein, partial [Azospirillum sp. B4]|uniref:beta strand repeat-containing protein n=1 Tax=Azospirillum sp. B4 TaxID=95605 RepID=UPI0005C865A5
RGLITGSGQAVTIRSNATLGLLINSAVIAGTILNQSARDLSIQGGDTVTGTFSGGLIANTASDLVFTSGRLLLNDAVDVTGHTLRNTGATVTLTDTIAVTGAYTQASGGKLVVGTTGQLAVSGLATVAGTVQAGLATDNFTIGQVSTLVSGAGGSDYGAAAVVGVGGMNVTGSVAGDSLLALHSNYYVGGTWGTLVNTGSITGASALYIASGGSLGTLVNAGVIDGGVINDSARDLTIAGQGGTLGRFINGSIVNTNADVVFASGRFGISDAIAVGSHTVLNSAASLALESLVTITGNYAQAGGTLAVTLGTSGLQVSGDATLAGGTVAVSPYTSSNYLAGSVTGTLVHADGTLSVGAVTLDSGLLWTRNTVVGNDLVNIALGDYIGGTLASLENTLTISGGSMAFYEASVGSIGTFTNSGALAANGTHAGNVAVAVWGRIDTLHQRRPD